MEEEQTTTDYEGLFSFTPDLADQLKYFLQRKEADLADSIQHSFLPNPGTIHAPFINTYSSNFHLSDIVSPLEGTVRQLCRSQSLRERQSYWNDLRVEINKYLWEYVEVIEGISSELYEELALVGFDRWRSELFEIIKKINEDLVRRVADLKLTIPKLERLLWEYRAWKQDSNSVRGILDRFQYWFTVTLDSGLRTNLEKTDQFLKIKFKDFSEKFDAYCKVDPLVSDVLDQNGEYIIIRKLDRSHQDRIILLSVLLKCWEQAKSKYKNLQQDITRSIYQSVNINRVPALLKEYSQALRQALFETARSFKDNDLNSLKPMLLDGISLIRKEVQGVKSTVSSYREFIQNKAPEQADAMVHLIYELQHLDLLYGRLTASLNRANDPEQIPYNRSLHREIEGILHTMGQPLMSKKGMRTQTHNLVPRLLDCDELGSGDEAILDFMGENLLKALRLDWKHQTLQEIPGFHELVAYHLGIMGPVQERPHINRYGKFKKIIQHIEQWVKGGKTYRHIDEIEADMNDIKEYLQDFLASIQRALKEIPVSDKETLHIRWETFSQMLLEYRYLFGNFFHVLGQQGEEGEYIRTQFLYIDRYFDAIEMQVHNMKDTVTKDELPEDELDLPDETQH